MVKTEAPDIRLTTINPGFVLGAPLDGDTGTSLAVIRAAAQGRDPMLPRLGFACVDVGDIAEMHLRAPRRGRNGRPTPESGRVGSCGSPKWPRFSPRPFPIGASRPGRPPDVMIRLIGLFDPTVRFYRAGPWPKARVRHGARGATLLGIRLSRPAGQRDRKVPAGWPIRAAPEPRAPRSGRQGAAAPGAGVCHPQARAQGGPTGNALWSAGPARTPCKS